MPKPEEIARRDIDAALAAAGWLVQDAAKTNLRAGRGVAIREYYVPGHGYADYLLYVDGMAVGVIEAKPAGVTLAGAEPQTLGYAENIPAEIPAARRPLPFLYQSTGVETWFTNLLDPEARSRRVFHFHRPQTIARWLAAEPLFLPEVDGKPDPLSEQPSTLRLRLRALPQAEPGHLWPAQRKAVRNLEVSLRDDRPRALIQMATGSGKTVTAITAIYRLIKFADATRVLFLVDRANLGRQALKEFQHFETPDDGRKFGELYNVQLLTSNKIDPVARVVITTIQRLYSMLQGDEDLDPALEEGSQFDGGAGLVHEPVTVTYDPNIPIEVFDFVFIDECHRSIYSLWRQVLEYFDAFLVGLTATPSKLTFGFFNQNLVMEYSHPQAVADGVNVDFDVYRIRTRITEQGSKVEASPEEVVLKKRDRESRKQRYERLEDDLQYDADALDRQVVAEDQIRTVIRTFKEKLFTDIFPGRKDVPKTLIYAKDDSHADDVVRVVREEFGRGNDFAVKITYRTTGAKPEDLISAFRNSYNPRVVVTVDMIATGTDIKPIEAVMFMRAVKSRNFFEQMKGRGVRVISETDFQAVTTDAKAKTHFVIVDCVGVCEQELSETYPLERQRGLSLERLMQAVAFGSTDPDILSSLASRLARLERRLGNQDRQAIAEITGGRGLGDITSAIVEALDSDHHLEVARNQAGLPQDADPPSGQVQAVATALLKAAAAPLAENPALRERIVALKRSFEQTIDHVSKDKVTVAGFSEEARERARGVIESFERFIVEHKSEITALEVLYSRPYASRLRFADIKALADAIQAPPRSWTPTILWRAYEALDREKVRGASATRLMTDIVSLVRFAVRQDDELVPFAERVETRFETWLAQHENKGRRFSDEQRAWLVLIRDHIAASFRIEREDFDSVPFSQRGGLGKVHRLFGDDLDGLIDELNEVLAA